MLKRNRRVSLNLLIGLALVPGGCRDAEPPPSYPYDLSGGTGAPLLAVSSPWHNLAIMDGSADWRDFRPPGVIPKSEVRETVGSEGAKPSSPGRAGEVEEEIREVVAALSDLTNKKEYGEVVGYFVERQQETVEKLLNAVRATTEKLDALMAAMEEKSPGSGEPLKALSGALSGADQIVIQLASLKVTGKEEAVGTLAGGGGEVRFVRLEEDWYVELPALDAVAPMLSGLDAGLQQLDRMIEAVRAGQLPPAQIVERLQALVDQVAKSKAAAQPPDSQPKDEKAAGTP